MRKIFAIIVTYNGMKWIEECLESVQSSSVPVEILIIDNNSSDNTVLFIKNRFPKVIVLENKQNLGFGKANNIGMKYALEKEADFVFLLNQDAKIEKNTIEKLICCFNDNKEYGILSPIHLNWNGDSAEYGFYNQDLFVDLILNSKSRAIYDEGRFINASCWLLPIKTIKTVGGFDPVFFHYGEDVNYCQRVLFHGLKLGIVADTKIYHDTTNNGTNGKLSVNSFLEIERNFKNQILIKFTNVNTNDYLNFNHFKNKIILKIFYYLITFNRKSVLINFQKYKVIKKLNVFSILEVNKNLGPTHLL